MTTTIEDVGKVLFAETAVEIAAIKVVGRAPFNEQEALCRGSLQKL